MATTGKLLAQGTLGTGAATTLYTVPASTITYVTSIRIVNVGASARTFNVQVKIAGGTARAYSDRNYSLAVGAGIQVLDDPQELRMGAGDIISGDASAVTDLEYNISGVEVT